MAEQGLSARQRAYLDAMGFDVLVSREAVAGPVAEAPVTPEPAAPVAQTPVTAEPAAAGRAPADAPDPGAADTDLHWQALRQAVARCTKCRLHETRTQSVFGAGPRAARLMVIGEAPGAEEDRTGEPFVGRAGQMLDAMLRAIGCDRDTVFIANTIKCRPPGNRDPRVDEVTACNDYLEQQLTAVAPDVVIAVGRIAAQRLLQVDMPLGRMRGKTHALPGRDVPLVVTYHPAYLLREPAQKARAWEDLKRVRALLSGGA